MSTTVRCTRRLPRNVCTDSLSSEIQIGRASSNVETRSSTKPETETEIGARRSRRVRSCEYDTVATASVASERMRQQPRQLATRTAPRGCTPSVVLLPPPPVHHPASDKVPRYNDTGSFEEVDERLLIVGDLRLNRRINSVAADEVRRRERTCRSLSTGSTSSSSLQDVVNAQYRKLWDLRATLEEMEDMSDEGQSESSTSPVPRCPGTAEHKLSESGGPPTNAGSSFLPLPSSRRQTYQHLAVERRLRQAAGGATTGGPQGPSVDSVEAPETDGDGSDTSRYDFTTTSLESSTTTTTTDNTDAGDSRVHPASSATPAIPRVQPGFDGVRRALEGEVVGLDDRTIDLDSGSQHPAKTKDGATTPQLLTVRRRCSEVEDVAKPIIAKTEPSKPTAAVPAAAGSVGGVAASLRSAARKRRDFRNERLSLHRLAVDHDDLHSSTDQPSGDSIDSTRLPCPGTSTTPAASPPVPPASSNPPSTALRQFLQNQLRSHTAGNTSDFRCRHIGSRDYSIDAKSDALFNEFVRHDVALESDVSHGRCLLGHRRLRHVRQASCSPGADGSQPPQSTRSPPSGVAERRLRRLGATSGSRRRSRRRGSDGIDSASTRSPSFRRPSPHDSIEEEDVFMPADTVDTTQLSTGERCSREPKGPALAPPDNGRSTGLLSVYNFRRATDIPTICVREEIETDN